MIDLLKRAEQWLGKTRRAYAAQTVRYVRGESSASLPATIGRSQWQTDNGSGFAVNSQSRDYLIQACDLTLDDIPAEPAVGDFIVETSSDGTDFQYEVIAPDGAPAWQWSDQYRLVYRIHTKYTGNSLASPP